MYHIWWPRSWGSSLESDNMSLKNEVHICSICEQPYVGIGHNAHQSVKEGAADAVTMRSLCRLGMNYLSPSTRESRLLPAYPPVACVATNWALEWCEDRQTPLPRPSPLRALAKHISAKTKTVLYNEPGGDYWEHWQGVGR
jgi:hypothetical protein